MFGYKAKYQLDLVVVVVDRKIQVVFGPMLAQPCSKWGNQAYAKNGIPVEYLL